MSVNLSFEPDFTGVNQVFGLGERWALSIIERFTDTEGHLPPEEVSKVAQAMSRHEDATEEEKRLYKAFLEASAQGSWLMVRC